MKKVGYAMYGHKSNLQELFNKLNQEEIDFVKQTIYNFTKDFAIVKFSQRKVSLIESEDWDSANEPTVGNSYCFSMDNNDMKVIKKSNKIYHNKWMFVASDYDGFDIEKAKERTKLWNSIPNIKEHKCRIGNKPYWETLLKENNIEL